MAALYGDRLSDYCDMAAEEIYNEWGGFINDIFVNIDCDVKSYDICDEEVFMI